MSELLSGRVADSALSIIILLAWITQSARRESALMTKLMTCVDELRHKRE